MYSPLVGTRRARASALCTDKIDVVEYAIIAAINPMHDLSIEIYIGAFSPPHVIRIRWLRFIQNKAQQSKTTSKTIYAILW